MKKKIPILIILLLALGASLFGLHSFYHSAPEGAKRQSIDESIAEEYLISIENGKKREETGEEKERETEETTEEEVVEETEFSDDLYYQRGGIYYTPEYAKGVVGCVLEIPSIELRRGVYTGSWESIDYDLDIWLTVASRPDYVLGETHYVIYGHNHPEQSLSFNKLKFVQPGDYFTLTNDEGARLYMVTDFYAEWREIVTRNVVDNFDLPKDKCYILTCGRDQYRYKDIIVVGTLYGLFERKEWVTNKEKILEAARSGEAYIAEIKEYNERVEEMEKNVFHIEVTQNEDEILTVLKNSEDEIVPATLALFDEDGLTIENWTQRSTGHRIDLTGLDEGKYVIGAVGIDNVQNYIIDDMEIEVSKARTVVRNVTEETVEAKRERWIPMIFIGMIALTLMAIIVTLIPKKRLTKKGGAGKMKSNTCSSDSHL